MRGRILSLGTACMVVLAMVLTAVLCPFPLSKTHAETASYNDPEKEGILADEGLINALSDEAKEKLYNDTKEDGYWVEVVEFRGKKRVYFHMPINEELTRLHKGIIVYICGFLFFRSAFRCKRKLQGFVFKKNFKL
ncbi:hypothetical protein [Caldicellulosiruptor naganoensis]|uniref:PepSY domain-containing protein n=1 Tax=Caldicellulosiruptor naganoensis TaxID=29324 RepID=A0ABY7BGQ9_9FIRM|nr:hypothetical protein [Caldicellulosiruptor naganoensis]WAM31655.1 hypothetical protein OTJ99_000086 [Caldicellulosiruptor naganoensis]